MTTYPEHEKLKKVQDESQAQGAFLEWCLDEGLINTGREWRSVEKALAKYHDINLARLEVEKRQMLDEMRQVRA